MKHALGKVEMTATQVSAALGLLRKVSPDLAATELTGVNGGPVQTERIERLIVDPANPDRQSLPPAA
jgi:hypothetical protein